MEIIHDAYNKNMKCPNCESTFRYNEKDIESAFLALRWLKKVQKTLKKLKDLAIFPTKLQKPFIALCVIQ